MFCILTGTVVCFECSRGPESTPHVNISEKYLAHVIGLDNPVSLSVNVCVCQVNLSHNKISFVTRHTFPSSPWVPYRLREVDLSYNAMPVLTYDITVGTKRVELLNVSHNILNEIRPSEYT
jgi:hypothetical protein